VEGSFAALGLWNSPLNRYPTLSEGFGSTRPVRGVGVAKQWRHV